MTKDEFVSLQLLHQQSGKSLKRRVKVINKSDSYTYSYCITHYWLYPIVGNLILQAFVSRKFIVTLLMKNGER